LTIDFLRPVGFWSYARQDDEEEAPLSEMLRVLKRELQQQYGRGAVEIFQDVGAIPPGATWRARITENLKASSFLVAVITPGFIQSRWCCREVSIFLERAKAIAAAHLEVSELPTLFPIYYIDIEGITPYDPAVLRALRELQWVDYRGLRFESARSGEPRSAISALATHIRTLLLTPLSSLAMPEEPEVREDRMEDHGDDGLRPDEWETPVDPRSAAFQPWALLRQRPLLAAAAAAAIILVACIFAASPHWRHQSPAPAEASDTTKKEDPRLAAASKMVNNWRRSDMPPETCNQTGDRALLDIKVHDGQNLELTNGGSAVRYDLQALELAKGWLKFGGGWWRVQDGVLQLAGSEGMKSNPTPYLPCPKS
jgi:hypothetical protein